MDLGMCQSCGKICVGSFQTVASPDIRIFQCSECATLTYFVRKDGKFLEESPYALEGINKIVEIDVMLRTEYFEEDNFLEDTNETAGNQ